MAIASLIIALISLLFGAFTYFRHDRKLKEQQRTINEYQIAKLQKESADQQRADVRVSIINVSGMETKTGTLVIKNVGKGVANNVQFIGLSSGEKAMCLPILTNDRLLSQDQIEFPISWAFDGRVDDGINVKLWWRDESGERRESACTLHL